MLLDLGQIDVIVSSKMLLVQIANYTDFLMLENAIKETNYSKFCFGMLTDSMCT